MPYDTNRPVTSYLNSLVILVVAAASRNQCHVTRIGCGLAGFTDEQIYPMFLASPANCLFDTAWKPLFDRHPRAVGEYKYWGTW